MSAPSDDRLRQLLGVAIALVGVGLAATAVDHLLAEHRDPVTLVVGAGFPLAMSFVTVLGGRWIATTDLQRRYVARVAGWWAFGSVVTGLMGVIVIVYEQSHGVFLVDGLYVITNNVTAGSAGGLLVGYFSCHSRRRADQLDAERRALATERERLEVLNRVVRHDIRNDMNVVLGWLDALADHVETADGRAALERVRTASEHVVELTGIAREYVAVVVGDSDLELQPVSLAEVLQNEVRTREASYPAAEFAVDGELPAVTVRANELLSAVFRNLLNNAVQHNDTDEPVVEVAAEAQDDAVVVTVADNGPGIPVAERRVIEEGEETPLFHGSGLGLWLIHWTVTLAGGEVRIEERSPRGSRVAIALPRASVSAFPRSDGPAGTDGGAETDLEGTDG
ncbi:MAG: ATP-binding protein [Halobacteriales archaeon]